MEKLTRGVGGVLGTLRAEFWQIFNRYFADYEHFDGNAREISQQVVDRLWYEDFYRTSLGHFDFFWMRDFGTVAESLVRIGNRSKVQDTLAWALYYYQRAGEVTLCMMHRAIHLMPQQSAASMRCHGYSTVWS